ncbi:MAG: hypothetical protein QT02_C0003G0036 [archaeon GW2011_AR9]|nr:MAG: hypothetical protein QT02_C0003G0036 [archaeon GW2011_AR9]MBS3120961.1 hypothetical protein [Candidatus Woesearchaeota archaeon]
MKAMPSVQKGVPFLYHSPITSGYGLIVKETPDKFKLLLLFDANTMKVQETKEYKAYKILEHWDSITTILRAEQLCNPQDKFFPLFAHLYAHTKELYQKVKRRKNGEDSFLHPLNIVVTLNRAKMSDALTLCVGLAHDLIEEKVDLYTEINHLGQDAQSIREIDQQEKLFLAELEQSLSSFCQKKGYPQDLPHKIILAVHLLTRNKKESYYHYLSEIFQCRDQEVKERAIQVKLADRTHNIQCIDCFNEEERIYQCFKNLFILNNVKRYLIQKYGSGVFSYAPFSPTERLFNKCSKATHDAFLTIGHQFFAKGNAMVMSMIQLAFKKYAYEKAGLSEVTAIDEDEIHPVRLFQGIIRKYDARLQREWDVVEKLRNNEKEYLSRFFLDFHFTSTELENIIDYKDAFALREVISKLLYQPQYVIHRFLCSELTAKGRISKI